MIDTGIKVWGIASASLILGEFFVAVKESRRLICASGLRIIQLCMRAMAS